MPDNDTKLTAELSAFVSKKADAAFKSMDDRIKKLDKAALKLDKSLIGVHGGSEKVANSIQRASRHLASSTRLLQRSATASEKASAGNEKLAVTTAAVASGVIREAAALNKSTTAKKANAMATERQRKNEERLKRYLESRRPRTLQERMTGVRGRATAVAAGAGMVAAAGSAVVGGTWSKAMEFDRIVAGIGITAGSSSREMERLKLQLLGLSKFNSTNQSVTALSEGLSILVAAGETLPDAMKMLPNIGKTALASQASMQDLSATSVAFAQNMGVAAGDIDKALSMAHQAGKLGRYELKAMAQGMPAMAAGAGNMGMTGLKGVAQITAAAQIWRQVVGNDSGTVMLSDNFFAKINSPEVNKKLEKEYNINLSKIVSTANAKGEDGMLAVAEALLGTVGKDAAKWGEIVQDMQARTALQALVKKKDEYLRNRDLILGEAGKEGQTAQAQRDSDAEQARKSAYSGFDRMKNSLESLTITVGTVFNPAMQKVAAVVEGISTVVGYASQQWPGLTTVVGTGTVAIIGIAAVIAGLATVAAGASMAIILVSKAMSLMSSRGREFARLTALRGGSSGRGTYMSGFGRTGRRGGRMGRMGGILGSVLDIAGFGDIAMGVDLAAELAPNKGTRYKKWWQRQGRGGAGKAGLLSRGASAGRGMLASAAGGVGMGGLNTAVGAAGALPVAGVIVAGTALGMGIAEAIEWGVQKATGEELSTHIANWFYSGVDKKNAEANKRGQDLYSNSWSQFRGRGADANMERQKAIDVWSKEAERARTDIAANGQTTENKGALALAESNIRNLQSQMAGGPDFVRKSAQRAGAAQVNNNSSTGSYQDNSTVSVTINGAGMTDEQMAKKTAEKLAAIAKKQKEDEARNARNSYNDFAATKG